MVVGGGHAGGRAARRRLRLSRAGAGAGRRRRAACGCGRRCRGGGEVVVLALALVRGAARLRAAAAVRTCCRSAARRLSAAAMTADDVAARGAAARRSAGAAAAVLVACLSPASARRGCRSLLALAPLPALAAALLAPVARRWLFARRIVPDHPRARPAGRDPARDGGAALDRGGVYAARRAARRREQCRRFAVCWLLTLTGSLGVFMAADLVSFYPAYALVSLPPTD